MSASVRKIVIDSGIIAAHLTSTSSGPTDLRLLMNKFFCYATVFQAIELFQACRTERERTAVERAFYAMKILGLNAKSGKNLGKLFEGSTPGQTMARLIAGLCIESRLPLVTDRPEAFKGIKGLDVRNVSAVLKSKE